MSNADRYTTGDSLTFYDIYRADQEQLERRLAQIQMFRELRAERLALAAERGLDPTPSPARGLRRVPRALRRMLRGVSGRSPRAASRSATPSSTPARTA